MRASEIPTAALVLGIIWVDYHTNFMYVVPCPTFLYLPLPAGVNVPDHDMTFQSLSDLLQQSVTPHVASVQAKECGGKRA